ncbi:MAG TPA: amidohydrolase [Candidatus Avimonas sp.]|nr:amidohydrolase [Candidatus Avimonas sp.]HQA16253.1 amidohydrolase [Candidatus Avimonas sp.]HQD37837.1 amidohydrolase [Candidatus Avimonas sp.]
MVIYNARIMPIDRPVIENGYVRIENGIIAELGAAPYTGADEDIFDAGGGVLLPGFVDAHTHLGMWEDGLGFEGEDGNEDTDPATPHLRAVDAVNPFDRCFKEALEAGITTVITGPGSSNPIGGQMCAMKTCGRRLEDMVIRAPIAVKMALGENPKTVYHSKNQAPVTRMATAAIIREQLSLAKRYDQDWQNSKAGKCDPPELDIKCEALLPVIKGELPVHFHAHRLDDIFTAVRIANEYNLKFVIIHGTQGHLAADLLADERIRLLCGPLICDRSKPELRDLTPSGLSVLHNVGIEFAIVSDHPVVPTQYLALCAYIAVREGLPYEQALKAMTLSPARICGIDDRVGSITPGKDADLALFFCDPLISKPTAVFCKGQRAV